MPNDWTPEMPLRVDATDEQINEREADIFLRTYHARADNLHCAVQVAREFAAAVSAEKDAEIAQLRAALLGGEPSPSLGARAAESEERKEIAAAMLWWHGNYEQLRPHGEPYFAGDGLGPHRNRGESMLDFLLRSYRAARSPALPLEDAVVSLPPVFGETLRLNKTGGPVSSSDEPTP